MKMKADQQIVAPTIHSQIYPDSFLVHKLTVSKYNCLAATKVGL